MGTPKIARETRPGDTPDTRKIWTWAGLDVAGVYLPPGAWGNNGRKWSMNRLPLGAANCLEDKREQTKDMEARVRGDVA